MKIMTATLLVCTILLAGTQARATECTLALAVQGISVLSTTGPGAGFPFLPSDIADTVPFIETLPAAGLDRMAKNVVAAQHWVDGLRLALTGQCGDVPLSLDERRKATQLVDEFAPWASAWVTALPLERQRRASDKTAAAGLCEAAEGLQDAQRRINVERSNPGGVVDLEVLHFEGQRVQMLTQALTARKRLFVRDRSKPFALGMCH